ncbi:aromatic compound dioxygenase [Mycena rebaudengoi]|nr:aromatic compound dioxygenase [Mycena rebaudengoi]
MRFSFISLTALYGVVAAVPTKLPKRSFYPEMLNLTCVISPEVPRNDYVVNPPARSDVTENQDGVTMILDIGVLDVTTCQPLPNVMVEMWGPNAQGNFGPTFLRGSTTTESNGIAEFQTIFPGYTSEGANHIGILIRSTSSESSGVVHVGQLFFTDPLNEIIGKYALAGYDRNEHTRILNDDDPTFVAANSNGYSSIVHINYLHDDWPQGIVGYITVGVDPTKN